ncbi:SC5A8 protein, partial [Pseudoatta argentina]
MTEINTLGWFDYLVIAIMLCISAAIGIYYRFRVIANRSMSILPVAIAMMASHLSALAFLGISAENYIYGTQIIGINLGYFLSIPILCYGFIPVFFKLQVTSIYESCLCIFLTLMGVNQVQIQRILTLKNMQAAQRAVWLCCPIINLLLIIICFSGLAIYSRYYNCNPFLEKRITSPDMLMPLYVMDTMSNISGLSGLFIAGIFSAGLSTISAVLNSLAAVTLEDYMKPLYRKYIGDELSPAMSISIAKVLVFTFGIVSIVLAFLVQFLDELLQTFYTISGIIGGPLLGIFILGMGTESATEGGAITDALITFSFLLWIVFGQPRPIPPKLPTTIKGCNNVNMTMSDLQSGLSHSSYMERMVLLKNIKIQIHSNLKIIINLSRLFIKNQNDELDTNLFFPMIARRIRHRRHNNKKNKENSLLNRRYFHSDEKADATDKIVC